jgi:hypothetical protein
MRIDRRNEEDDGCTRGGNGDRVKLDYVVTVEVLYGS